ncbi:zinc ribbon domain-containing protein [Herbinix luporum]|uniref:zinc ribbon domain-containing protein n=1 Tax=Herbinix luporum TaxID=1679721 RepID=UPI001765FB58|nr:zinc ribbon domain-containing protein [Herbinix luporum]MDI9488937.1 zinc ribbon domain-containing protein [Bacillota bacterium]HHT58042.1 zinc ribbon domain-containing protein [Herbinix luporum]
MFFIFAISNGEKQLDFNQTMICSHCGQFGRFNAYMTYMYFSLFFIPLIFWNRKYYIKSTCCNTVYSLNPDIGKKIRRGEEVSLSENDMEPLFGSGQGAKKHCAACGYLAEADFDYCPKCGSRL